MKHLSNKVLEVTVTLSFMLFAVLTGCLVTESKVSAKTYSVYDNYYGGTCSVVVAGNKVYFSTAESGSIECYNIKTGKTTKVAQEDGDRFLGMKKKGKYLYAIYDAFGGSDDEDYYVVRVNINNGKMETLAKGCNFVIKKNKIYFTKAKRIKYNSEYGDDQVIGVYSMGLDGKNQKACPGVTLSTKAPEKIKTSKGTLISTGTKTRDGYSPNKLVFQSKKGKKKTLYDLKKDKKIPEYPRIDYFTIQGDYVIYKTYHKGSLYTPDGILVIMKTNGKGKKTFYKRPSVSAW